MGNQARGSKYSIDRGLPLPRRQALRRFPWNRFRLDKIGGEYVHNHDKGEDGKPLPIPALRGHPGPESLQWPAEKYDLFDTLAEHPGCPRNPNGEPSPMAADLCWRHKRCRRDEKG